MLSISRWDLNWASGYLLDRPRPFELGRDRLYVECRYDNSAAHQPMVDGVRGEPRDVEWGVSAADEMCQIAYVFTPGDASRQCEVVASSSDGEL